MIKGGFQGLDISGVDLTAQSPSLPGGYAACQAAEGKTVLVLTAAGAVQCSVKKVSTNYVLAGITGDGKILSITIDSTDGISVSEMTPSAEPSGELKVSAHATTGFIPLSTLLEDFTTMTFDGYVQIKTSAAETKKVTVNTHSLTDGVRTIGTIYGSGSEQELFTFVKKGMKIKIIPDDGVTVTSGGFFPLIAS